MNEFESAKAGFFSGTSGVVVPLANKQLYPQDFQDKSRLSYYASLFNSIEINSSFYKLPMASTVRRWAESVPDDFRFTFKLWREITHVKELAFNSDHIDRFIEIVAEVGDKKGCLLVQFPPSLTVQYLPGVSKLLERIAITDPQRDWKIALEFRNSTWYTDQTIQLLDDHKTGIVLHDKLSAANTLTHSNVGFVYLRFHGYNGDYKGSYEDDFLNEYAHYIREWMVEGQDVYVYFNNTRGDAVNNLVSLNRFIHELELNDKEI